MREDPIISGGLAKVLIAVFVLAGLGFGGYKLIDSLDIDLESGQAVDPVVLEDVDLGDITINGKTTPEGEGADPFTRAGFARTKALLLAAVDGTPELTRVIVNESSTQFYVRRGEEGDAYVVDAVSGEVQKLDTTITITGNAKLADFVFSPGAVQPGAVARILAKIGRDTGKAELRSRSMTLERGLLFGDPSLRWTVNVQAGNRNLTYRAPADGRSIEQIGGGSKVPQAALDAQKLAECVQAAGSDVDAALACLERY